MPDNAITRDSFLGGKLILQQPAKGYRAGIDPVLLAASTTARPQDSVLELGCGVGAAMLCLATRVPGLALCGLELQPDYAELCRQNAENNRIKAHIYTGDLTQMPSALRQQQFQHVIMNPPYFDRTAGTTAPDPGRETALGEATPLTEWIKAAARRTAPKGYVTLIHRAERLPEILQTARYCLGSLELLPIIPRRNKSARLILLRGQKGGRAAFQCHDAWLLHDGLGHQQDGDDYTNATSAILRDGAPLSFTQI